MRRSQAKRREVAPDPQFQSVIVTSLVNKIMKSGKKSVAEGIVYSAMAQIEEQTGRRGIDIFEQALRNITPIIEVKPRRVGGATYQVPIDIRTERRQALALRWLIDAARKRGEKSMGLRLAQEIVDASDNKGTAVKKREDVHRMAEANKAFAHYRW